MPSKPMTKTRWAARRAGFVVFAEPVQARGESGAQEEGGERSRRSHEASILRGGSGKRVARPARYRLRVRVLIRRERDRATV